MEASFIALPRLKEKQPDPKMESFYREMQRWSLEKSAQGESLATDIERRKSTVKGYGKIRPSA
jgi:hypothetical protein